MDDGIFDWDEEGKKQVNLFSFALGQSCIIFYYWQNLGILIKQIVYFVVKSLAFL